MSLFSITVPASTANIGPGFDSIGMAINRYLTLQIVKNDPWEFNHLSPFLPHIKDYQEHLIYQVANKVSKRYKKPLIPCKVNIDSQIPLARGLGSSASAVVAGIELANQLCELSLTTEEKLLLATEIEGHPDNVAPALLGGLVVVATTDNKVNYIQIDRLNLDIVLYIPEIELKTTDARDVLPSDFSRNEAASASSISNVLVASLLTDNYELAGKMMENDLFHEPYRAKLIPNYERIRYEAKQNGAYGTVISGAGPTMLSFVPKGKGRAVAEKMNTLFKGYEVDILQMAHTGSQVKLYT